MSRWTKGSLSWASVALLAACVGSLSAVRAEVLLTRQQALAAAFPDAQSIQDETLQLDETLAKAAQQRAHAKVQPGPIQRCRALRDGKVVGWGYFDTHVVRTMPETILVALAADGTVQQVLILAFAEPDDYRPRPKWLEKLGGAHLDEQLAPGKGVPRVSGATLTTQALTEAVRRILAIHELTSKPVTP